MALLELLAHPGCLQLPQHTKGQERVPRAACPRWPLIHPNSDEIEAPVDSSSHIWAVKGASISVPGAAVPGGRWGYGAAQPSLDKLSHP